MNSRPGRAFLIIALTVLHGLQSAAFAQTAGAARASADGPLAGRARSIALGTVLYSADERALLDGRRPKAAQVSSAGNQSEYRFDGYMRQADQPPVIWLNGEAGVARDGVQIEQGHAIVRINGSARRRLAPGQGTAQPELGEGNSAAIVEASPANAPATRQWRMGDDPLAPRR